LNITARPFDYLFYVLGVVVDTADDDQILYPSGNEQFTGFIEETKIAGTKVTPAVFW